MVLGLVYNYVPFVILAVYSALQRLDPSLAEASRDLGAGAWATFLRVTLPLTASGVAAGAVFVFVLSIGNFVTPDLLGGGKVQMVGNLIYDQFLTRSRLAVRRGAVDGSDRGHDGAAVHQCGSGIRVGAIGSAPCVGC